MKTWSVVCALLSSALAFADGPADNLEDKVRPVPPPGIAIPLAERSDLQKGLKLLDVKIGVLGEETTKPLRRLLPDVRIFADAVRYAMKYNEFYDIKEIAIAKELLRLGQERADQLAQGKAPWATANGLVVRGYRSKLDGSVQPYGLVVPKSFDPKSPHKHRLDLWCHGRGEKLTELSFLNGRMKSPGEFVPQDGIVLHLYGRYCNANKFAGEIDALEAMAEVKKHYPIDENRVVIRGFSMGGAACWQFAVHYPDLWAAAAPGAGFSETPEFLKHFQKETLNPAAFEKKLWHWYDCTDYALNVFNVPTVAYSGENDIQKQAADIMADAIKQRGLELVHIIGPKTGHSYHPDAKREINKFVDAAVARGRNPVPAKVRFETWTLRYNRCFWVVLEGLEKHWERATVDAEIVDKHTIKVTTRNVSRLKIAIPPSLAVLEPGKVIRVTIDGETFVSAADRLSIPKIGADGSFSATFVKSNQWTTEAEWFQTIGYYRTPKQPGLQGPIDDAFMDSFLIVRPTGKAMHKAPAEWVQAELPRALAHWRKQFRGEARVKDDVDVTEQDIVQHNLILWGDSSSNRVLGRIGSNLPIRWHGGKILAGNKEYDAAGHMPALIYPNPLNPKRYVVLNSGFTFRDYDYLNNARQVPKLPDWAVFDLRTAPNARWPGKVTAAGFFDERWQLTGSEP